MPQRRFSILVPDDLIRQLEIISLAHRKSRNALIKEAIENMVAENGTEAKATIKAMLEEKGAL